MPNSALAPSIISGASNLGTAWLNYRAQKEQNELDRKYQEFMYNKQRQDAQFDWNQQNQYNSPEQQMNRLRQAGLNPNLVYGKGAEKIEILEKIKELKAKQAEQDKAEDLLRIKKEVEAELKKLEELKSLEVIDDEEFEIAQVKLNKKVNNFEKLYSLKIAFERGLINEQEYTQRKASLE